MKRTLVLLVVAAVMVACTKPQKSITSIEGLKPVVYNQEAAKEVSAKKTGRVLPDPTTGKNRDEYLVTWQKQYLLKPMSVVKETDGDVIYPGSIIRGDSFLKGIYDPLVLENEFNPVTLSMTLKGDINVSAETKPVLSHVRETMNILLAKNKDKIDYKYVPAIWSFESHEITTEESMKIALKVHASVALTSGIAKADFSYEQNQNSSSKEKYIMVAFRQVMYNAAIDPKHYTQWIKGNISLKDMGEYEPLYISSIEYGRTGYILVQTTQSASETMQMIKASISAKYGYVQGEADTEYSKQLKQLFSENKVKVKIYGGPVALGNKVTNYDGFMDFVKMPDAETLTKTSVPVSYKVRRLKDNTLVDVLDTYTESKFELRD
jgi:flavomodulin